jgi:hypothetical protein
LRFGIEGDPEADASGLWTMESLPVSDDEYEDAFLNSEETNRQADQPNDTMDSAPEPTKAQIGQFMFAPTKDDAHAALNDLTTNPWPQRLSGIGYKPFPFPKDEILRQRLEMMHFISPMCH